MKKFNEEKFKTYLKNRNKPNITTKDLVYDNIKVKNVPVILQENGSNEFTLQFGTTSKIYKLLLFNNNQKKTIDFNQLETIEKEYVQSHMEKK